MKEPLSLDAIIEDLRYDELPEVFAAYVENLETRLQPTLDLEDLIPATASASAPGPSSHR